MAPLDYIIDICLVAFKDCFYATIRQIAYPASDSMFSRYLFCVLSKINSLHLAFDEYLGAIFFLGEVQFLALHLLIKKMFPPANIIAGYNSGSACYSRS